MEYCSFIQKVIENMGKKRQDQHRCTRSGEQSSLNSCAVPVTSVHATASAEAFSISQLRGDLYHQNTFRNVFSHTVSVDSRCLCCHHFQNTRYAVLGTQPQVSRFLQCLANSFTWAETCSVSLSRKCLALLEKAFCTSAILLRRVTSGNCTGAPTSLERKCTAVPADRGCALPGTPWASHTNICLRWEFWGNSHAS